MKYKTLDMGRYHIIVKNGEIATDKEIGMLNSFIWESEAIQLCEDLNKDSEDE